MARMRQQPYNERGQSLFMKDTRGTARPRASIPSPLSTYSIYGELTTNDPPELAAHMGPRTLPTATVQLEPKMRRQSTEPQGGQLRVANGKLSPRIMTGDDRPRYLPYHGRICVNDAHDVRDQVYRAYAPKPSSRQSERILDDHRTTVCLSHVHRPNYLTGTELTAVPAASRGFPILADSYGLDHRPSKNFARPEHENSHPHVLRIGKLKHRHASMAVPEAITDPELTGSARLKQSFETRRRVREPRSAIY